MKRMSPPIDIGHACYCARCQAPTHEGAVACASCEASFEGAGRFDRIAGDPPSTVFAFLFARDAARTSSRVA